jgi:DNA-binding transcriptional LysR family regulator
VNAPEKPNDLPLDVRGTAFQEAVWRELMRIPAGETRTYAQIAAAIVDFLKLHPQLKVDLNASEGALNLVETRIDLAIRISAEPDPALIGRVLAPCTSVLVASPPIWPTAVCR